jgi:hypothetical protein
MLVLPRAKPAAAAACICIAASIFIAPSPAHSQWIDNGAPVCTEPYVQDDPAIVSDGAGGAIIVWEDDRPDWFSDIYALERRGRRIRSIFLPPHGGQSLDIAQDGAA